MSLGPVLSDQVRLQGGLGGKVPRCVHWHQAEDESAFANWTHGLQRPSAQRGPLCLSRSENMLCPVPHTPASSSRDLEPSLWPHGLVATKEKP